MNLRRSLVSSTLLLALATLPSIACSGGGGGNSTTNPAGTVAEMEPNDVLGNANPLGDVDRTTTLAATGRIAGLGVDQFDSYELKMTQDATLQLSVKPSSGGSDVDLWVTSADGTVQARFEAGAAGATETGTFAASNGDTLYLVVLAFDADTDYELTVQGS